LDPKVSTASDQASSREATHETQSARSETQDSTGPAESKAIVRSAGGPRTSNGKKRSRLNALKHGFFSKALLLEGESRKEFNYLLNKLFNDLQPVGMLEGVLVDKLAAVLWRHRRLLIAEGQQFEKTKGSIFLSGIEPEGMRMELLLRHGPSLDRELDRILKQLERLQRIRLGQPVPPSIDVNIAMEGSME
jgi:hypothetical protein